MSFRVTIKIERAGLEATITRTAIRDLFTSASNWERRDMQQTVVDRAQVVLMSHGLISDGRLVLSTNGTPTDEQVIQALDDDVFRPQWRSVSDKSEAI